MYIYVGQNLFLQICGDYILLYTVKENVLILFPISIENKN